MKKIRMLDSLQGGNGVKLCVESKAVSVDRRPIIKGGIRILWLISIIQGYFQVNLLG